MKVAVFSTKSYDKEFLNNVKGDQNLVYYEAQLNADTVNLTQGFDAVCIFVNDRCDADIIGKLKQNGIRFITLRCAGFNNVDLQAAKEAGIKVARVPAYSPEAVAEHAVALIMTLNRKTHKAYLRIKENNYSLERLTGFNIHGKTVGVIGTGHIGQAFIRIMKGFGTRIVAYDPYPTDLVREMGVEYTDMETLLSESDIISLHCPLTKENHHLINSDSIAKMKDNVMLINTSRGGLLDTKATIKGLKTQKIGYLGIDVYEQEEHLFYQDLSEEIIEDDTIARLMSFPNVIMTAHQGFFTKEALTEIASVTMTNLRAFEDGKESGNEIN